MPEPIGTNPSPFSELTIEEVRYGVEILATSRPDSLQLVVDGAPPELKVTFEELALYVLARELFKTSVGLHALQERFDKLEARTAAGRN